MTGCLRALISVPARLITWVPLIVLGVLAYSYLSTLYFALLAPGTNLTIPIPTEKGDLTLAIDSYSIDPVNLGINGAGIRLLDPLGRPIASATSIRLNTTRLKAWPDSAIQAEVRGLVGTLERDETGKFPLFEYFKPPAKEEKGAATSVRLVESTITFVDRSVRPRFRDVLQLEEAQFDGSEKDWSVTAEGRLRRSGRFRVKAIGLNDRIDVDAVAGQFEAAKILTAYKGLFHPDAQQELAKLNFGSFVADGPIRVQMNTSSGEFHIVSQAELYARRLGTSYWNNPISARFAGDLTESGLDGVLRVEDGASRAVFDGSMDWSRGFKMLGRLDGRMASLNSLPKEYWQNLPRDVTPGSIAMNGVVGMSDETGFVANGSGQIDRIKVRDEVLQNVAGTFQYDAETVSAIVDRASWRNETATGAFKWLQKSDAVSGFLESNGVNVARLVRRYANVPVVGNANVKAIVRGKLAEPDIVFAASGRLRTTIEKQRFDLGLVEARGSLEGDLLKVDRIFASTKGARIALKGTVDLKSQALDLSGSASGYELGTFAADARGDLSAKLTIKGTTEKPEVTGRAEILGLEFQNQFVPVVVANFEAGEKRIKFTDVAAGRGASAVTGQFAVDYKSKALAGTFEGRGIQLTDWFAEDVAGSLNVSSGRVSGTLDKPRLSAHIDGSQVVAQGIVFDTLSSEVEADGNAIQAKDLRLRAGDGTILASANYSFKTSSGQITGSAIDLPLERFVPILQGDTLVDGFVGGAFSVRIENEALKSLEADGSVRNLTINEVAFGGGTMQLGTDMKNWTISGAVGQPERYAEVTRFEFNTDSRRIAGDVVAHNMPVEDIYRAIRPKLVPKTLESKPEAFELPADVVRTLDQIKAGLNADVTLGGTLDDPIVDIRVASLENIALAQEPAGRIELVGRRGPRGYWSIAALKWTEGPGIAQIQGTVDEHGDVALNGSVNNFNPQWLARFEPGFAKVDGRANLEFEATGPVESPEVIGSLDANVFEIPDPEKPAGERSTRLNFNLAPFRISETGMTLEGSFNYQGIAGSIEGKLPLRYPFELPHNEPLDIVLSVAPKDLADLQEFLPKTELEPLTGTVQGRVQIGGTYSRIVLDGSASAHIDKIASKGSREVLRNVDVSGTLSGDSAAVQVTAESGDAGKVDGKLTLSVPDLLAEFDGDIQKLLDGRVTGELNLQNIRLNEKIGADGSGAVSVVGAGKLLVDGTARSPRIYSESPLLLDELRLLMPSAFAETAPGAPPPVVPRFDVRFSVGRRADPGSVRAVNTSLELYGDGALEGDLVSPELTTTLTVRRGTIRLPNARIAIEEGGRVRVAYDPKDLDQPTRADVDLHGRTAISTLRLGGSVQRYDIDLRIRGNLLDEESVILEASSDPPDLTQARILNLLGQESLIQSLASQFVGGRDDRALTSALTSLALPALFDPLTERIAQELGLDFLTLEYNAFEGATITAAKNLGGGFSLQGRRQISETIQNRILFDYRLTYRPKVGGRTLRSLIFSIGADQDRPYKISVEYGIRF